MRQIYLLDLKDEALAADYEAAHAPGGVPEGVLADIAAAGIRVMQIWRTGTRLVLLTETDPGADAADRVGSADSIAWEQQMDRFQTPLPWAEPGAKWTAARCIFDLADHPPEG